MLRFVILEHQTPPDYPRSLHWDLMLEVDGALRTWALSRCPEKRAPIPAELLADHRLDYLEIEGPLSGNRGTVRRWDRGTYAVLEQSADRLVVVLRGATLSGRAALERCDGDAQRWSFSITAEA